MTNTELVSVPSPVWQAGLGKIFIMTIDAKVVLILMDLTKSPGS